MLFSLAWKNVWRNKVRSGVLIAAITVGVIGGSGFVAFFNGLVAQRIHQALNHEVSAIMMHHRDFQSNRDLKDTIPNLQKVCHMIDSTRAVKAYALRLKIVSMIASANNNQGIMLNGIDPQRELQVNSMAHCVVQGTYFLENRHSLILVGQKLAQKLKVKLHSKLVVTLQDTSGNLISTSFRVGGIFRSGNSMFDQRQAYVRREELAALTGFHLASVHEIAISVKDVAKSQEIAQTFLACGKFFPELKVETWKEAMPELALMSELSDFILYIFMGIVFLALSFGVINTMMMAVLDRVKEFGMLMAIGMSRMNIFSMILGETIIILLVGSALGLLCSFLLIQYFQSAGIDLSAFASGLEGAGFSTVVYPFLAVYDFVKIILMVLLVGFLSSLLPARKALRLNVSEAIRTL
jgi:ABC-type lipoprotein release transport system permease subunit